MRDRLSSMTIEPVSGSQPHKNITNLCWPNYRRVSSWRGGDLEATFSFTAPMDEIERWFDDYLGWEFKEWMFGSVVFSGIVSSVRLNYRGDTIVKNLENMANAIAIEYEDVLGNTVISAFQTDADSIAKYGRKELIINASEVGSSGSVSSQLTEAISRMAWPKTRLSDVALFGQEVSAEDVPVLEVTVLGWSSTLNWIFYNNTGSGTDTVDTLVSDMLNDSSIEYVTEGTVDASGEDAPEKSVNRPILDRIISLADIEGWVAGCFAGKSFDFFAHPETLIYDRYVLRNKYGALEPVLKREGAIINPAIIRPYGYIRINSVFIDKRQSGISSSELGVLARITQIEYTMQGVKFTTSNELVNAKEDYRKSVILNAIKESGEFGGDDPRLIGPPPIGEVPEPIVIGPGPEIR